MKSKKKTKKSKAKKIRKEIDKVTKRKHASKQLKELKDVSNKPKTKGQEIREGIDALRSLMEQEKYKNPHYGSAYYTEASITTDPCDCTPVKGCLDPQEAIQFTDHQVHEGYMNKERAWKEEVMESEETKASWVDSFLSIFGFKRSK